MDTEISQLEAQLSAAKRNLFHQRLRGEGTKTPDTQKIAHHTDHTAFPLSFAQQRLWFLEHYEGGSLAYNIPFGCRISGQVHVTALERSLNEIVRRHDVLRTAFKTVEGNPETSVLPLAEVSLPFTDLREMQAGEREKYIADFACQDARQGFDLERPPLLRSFLFRCGNAEYILLMMIHHIIFDGWSIEVFMRELAQLYDDFSCGKGSSLSELQLQYGDFSRWQREWLKGETLKQQFAYWRKQLSDCSPLLMLPTDRPRPAKQTFCGSTHAFRVPDSITRDLKALSQPGKSTLFMTLLTAFNVLLYRYSGQEDILVGSPVAHRQRSELGGLIGFFVNMLVLRGDLSGDPTFYKLLERVCKATLEAQAHQDIPFDLLVEELHPERDLSYQPFFQVVFALRNTPEQYLRASGIRIEPMLLPNGMSKFDLFLEILVTEQGLQGSFEYNSDLFDADTIRRMSRHFLNLLEGIAACPECRISELPLLDEAERHQLLVAWNGTTSDYPKNATIQDLFEAQAAHHPERIALVFKERKLCYRELNERANQVAHYLKKIGVKPEMPVGICMERSLDMIIGLLGILKAGGTYVPFDCNYPAERLTFILEDTGVAVLLTRKALVATLPSNNARLVCLDSDWQAIASEPEENPGVKVSSDNLAYIMYTSGSTGQPKGVCVTHRGVVRLVKDTDYVELSAEDSMLQYAPISFDASTFEIWGALLNGARLVIMPGSNVSLAELGRVIRHEQISILWLTAGLFHLMVDERLDDLRSVRQLLAGGDVLSVPHVQHVRRKMPTCRLINGYGPTESTTFACCFTVPESVDAGTSIPIGRPIADTEAYILDRNFQPVPVGVAGELHLGGAGLAREYLNRPKLTAERFIANPFSDEPGTRLYKTGDLARYLPDGNIEFLGRIDRQVKIRGFRIELGEIESVLLHHTAIHEAVVLARQAESGDKYLSAYLVADREQKLSTDELRRFLGVSLPDYMIPAFFTFLDTLPLTPNGKIDRRALPEPAKDRSENSKHFTAPRNSAEERMLEIWASLLPVKSIGVHDDFFELGGHSLLTVRLVTEIEKLFQVRLPLWKLFETPTIAGLVRLMQQEAWEGPAKSVLERQKIDYDAETLLDEVIQVEENFRGTAPKNGIFLTGATGFLGAFLLHELLQQTQADVYCLVRASGAAEAHKRIEETLREYLIWSEPLKERIVPVPGDLSLPLFGLSSETFDELARNVDMIYHSGAQVNLQYPYAALKAANVRGTREVLRLAAKGGGTSLHFVSTVGVFSGAKKRESGEHSDAAPGAGALFPSWEGQGVGKHARGSRNACTHPQPLPGGELSGFAAKKTTPAKVSVEHITEDRPLPPFEELTIGYAQTKWVAEKLMAAAHRRGIPVSIYRPGRISGHSMTGVWNLSDLACRTIKGCVEAGIAPDRHVSSESWVPVDYVSQAIVHLSQKTLSAGQVFHLVNRKPLDWNLLFTRIAGLGYPLKILPYERWRREFCERAQENELTPLMPLFPEHLPETPAPHFANWNTIAGLEGSSIRCPAVDDALLYSYFGHFLRSMHLSAPQ